MPNSKSTPIAAEDLLQCRALLRQREVVQLVGFDVSTIYRKIKTGNFPRPVNIGERSVRWRSDDIREWLAELTLTA